MLKAVRIRVEPVPLLDKYIIIDTQGGYQDVAAIVAILKLAPLHHRSVIGITCGAGRRSLNHAVRDALIAQAHAGTSVPVYRGSNKSLMLRTQFPPCIDLGTDFKELDDFALSAQSQKLIQTKAAAIFLEESISKYNKQLCIINLGPMTNNAVALHLSRAKDSFSQVSSIRVNGGSYSCVGNVVGHPSSEANFFFDPEAAQIIISNYQNVYVTPIEVTLETDLSKAISNILQTDSSKQSKQVLKSIQKKKYQTCGPLLTALSVFNKSITPSVAKVYSEVVSTDQTVQGQTVNNWLRLDIKEGQEEANTNIFTVVDHALLEKVLDQAFR